MPNGEQPPFLHEEIVREVGRKPLARIEIPSYITDNLKHPLYKWQVEAMQRLLAYHDPENGLLNTPTHLLFNMATGSGKTLLMAAAMLYYYKRGYRHFLFFVNQKNIVDKTETNFIDATHNKYLFDKDAVVVGNKTIPVTRVNTFSDNSQGIEIIFTTIQQLYNDIHIEKENQTTLDDLQKRDLVLIADEAHHLNAAAKADKLDLNTAIDGKTSRDEVEWKGWERTVIELVLNKRCRDTGKELVSNRNNKNVLLEWTATVPTGAAVTEKYRDKLIYQFGLKEFLKAGFTKQINLISSTFDKEKRVLHALLFHWYRHTIALRHGIANFKPVILFRSKTIAESWADYNWFNKLVAGLRAEDFNFLDGVDAKILKSKEKQQKRGKNQEHETGFLKTEQLIAAARGKKSAIADFLRANFTAKNVVITNSQTNKTQNEKTDEGTDKLLNSLEDKGNPIRAIFTVKRLTEGWDVLNLFDIVRLYEGQNAGGGNKNTPEATVQEKQLIGRGVRYYPFAYGDKPTNERKFDKDTTNELRLLEELFYYTHDDAKSRYISHLKDELRKDGFINDGKVRKDLGFKPEFMRKSTGMFKQRVLWRNYREGKSPDDKMRDFKEIKRKFAFNHRIEFAMGEGGIDGKPRAAVQTESPKKLSTKLFKTIPCHIIRKAVNMLARQDGALYRFENLREKLSISSIDDLLADKFFGNIKMSIITTKPEVEITNQDWLEVALLFLQKMEREINAKIADYRGGEFVRETFEDTFGEEKVKYMVPLRGAEAVKAGEIADHDWYALKEFVGNKAEAGCVDFINDCLDELRQKYANIWLVRNEEVYKIHNFDDGRGFQPDFILFLKDRNNTKLRYQIFIEPKGKHIADGDKWKEKFMLKIAEKYGDGKLLKFGNKNFKLIGLPFYDNDDDADTKFADAFNEKLLPPE